jgi:hypothetical protein
MNQLKTYLVALIYCTLLSCNQNITTIYYNDNTKVDDGEIFGEHLASFFAPDKNIYIQKIKSAGLKKELKIISDSLNLRDIDTELDDSYYGYAFITSSKDTLFASYSLSYWKSRHKSMSIQPQKLNTMIYPLFENPYLKSKSKDGIQYIFIYKAS